MIAWLFVCLSLTLQLPNSNNAGNPAEQRLEAPRFWIQAAAKGSETEPNLNRLTVQTSALPEVGAAQFDLVFNSERLKQPELLAGKLLGNALLESNLVAPGRLRVAFVSSEPIIGPGELVILQANGSDTLTAADQTVRLENVKAWKSTDSTELAIELGQATQPVVTVTEPPPSAAPNPGPANAAATAPAMQTFAANPLPTNLQVTLNGPLEVHLQLPGWLYFIAGSLTTLIAGAICLFVLKRN